MVIGFPGSARFDSPAVANVLSPVRWPLVLDLHLLLLHLGCPLGLEVGETHHFHHGLLLVGQFVLLRVILYNV